METGQFKQTSIIIKMVAVGFLALILLIPTAMISELINERERTRDTAINEVSSKWGNPQIIAGPILTVPYKKTVELPAEKGEKPKVAEETAYAHFLPMNLQIKSALAPEMRQRGIYEVAVYNALSNVTGEFGLPDIKSLDNAVKSIMWQDAVVSVGISDVRGIKDQIKLNWNGKTYAAKPGLGTALSLGSVPAEGALSEKFMTTGELSSGVNFKIALDPSATTTKKYAFAFDLKLNGSRSLDFLPLGAETNAEMISSWTNPSFGGAFLPDERALNDNGFTSKWKVLELNRNFAQSWLGTAQTNMSESAFGVELLIPVDEYQKNMRSVKYAILTIALTFLIFFFVEVKNKIRVHPFHYILVGLALVLFFSLLLSISEYLNFNLSYAIAAVATISAVGWYSRHIFNNNKLSLLQSGILAFIYMFIFTIIQLQDYALLVGNIGLFVVLMIVMYISKKIDWYGVGEKG